MWELVKQQLSDIYPRLKEKYFNRQQYKLTNECTFFGNLSEIAKPRGKGVVICLSNRNEKDVLAYEITYTRGK